MRQELVIEVFAELVGVQRVILHIEVGGAVEHGALCVDQRLFQVTTKPWRRQVLPLVETETALVCALGVREHKRQSTTVLVGRSIRTGRFLGW